MNHPKVLEMEKYCVYLPFSELHGWIKRFTSQPLKIYLEFPSTVIFLMI